MGNMQKVFVLGSINCDLVMEAPKLPQAGETLSGQGFFINPGGKGANQAVASSKLGAETYMLGAIGRDVFGNICFESLKKYGCSVQFVKEIQGKPTGIASIWVSENDNRILLDGGANLCLDEPYIVSVLEKYAKEGDILVCQLEIDPGLVEKAFSFAKRLGMKTLLNPAPVPEKGISPTLLKLTDIIVPNETETETICGFPVNTKEDMRNAVKFFNGYGVETVLITLGANGAYFCGGGIEKRRKAFTVRAIDTTAAGDTTIGALACRLAAGYTVAESMDFCAAASAITVSRMGAQQSIPSYAEVIGFLEKHPE